MKINETEMNAQIFEACEKIGSMRIAFETLLEHPEVCRTSLIQTTISSIEATAALIAAAMAECMRTAKAEGVVEKGTVQ